jgi:hypothetical protein
MKNSFATVNPFRYKLILLLFVLVHVNANLSSRPSVSLNISSTANVNFKAGNYITINPISNMGGFTSGSFTAEIVPVCNTITSINNAKTANASYIPLLDDCNSWLHLSDNMGDEGSQFIMQYNVLYDTLINSNLYKKISVQNVCSNMGAFSIVPWSCASPSIFYNYEYWREDVISQKIYALNLTTLSEQLVYNFNLNIGDTMFFSSDLSGPYSGFDTVVSISTTTMLDGSIRETFVFNSGLVLIEGIGYFLQNAVGFNFFTIRFYEKNNLLINKNNLEFDTLTIHIDTTICSKKITTLALDLLHFTTTSTCDDVTLQWAMAHDEALDYCTLQRSTDAQTWIDVAQIPTLNTGNAVESYTYTDPHKATASNYYRIASTSNSDTQDYSSIQTVKNNCGGDNTISITPNPSSGVFSIHSTNQSIAKIAVLDVQGKTVYQQSATPKNQLQSIDISALANGIYLLNITATNGTISTHKIVKH